MWGSRKFLVEAVRGTALPLRWLHACPTGSLSFVGGVVTAAAFRRAWQNGYSRQLEAVDQLVDEGELRVPEREHDHGLSIVLEFRGRQRVQRCVERSQSGELVGEENHCGVLSGTRYPESELAFPLDVRVDRLI